MEDDDPTPEIEKHLMQVLQRLRLEYERAAKPYIDQLVRIHSTRLPQPMLFEQVRLTTLKSPLQEKAELG